MAEGVQKGRLHEGGAAGLVDLKLGFDQIERIELRFNAFLNSSFSSATPIVQPRQLARLQMSLSVDECSDRWGRICSLLKRAEEAVAPFCKLMQNNPYCLLEDPDVTPAAAAAVSILAATYMTELEYVRLQLSQSEMTIANHKIQIELDRVARYVEKMKSFASGCSLTIDAQAAKKFADLHLPNKFD